MARMKRRIAETIVRFRILILIAVVLTAGWSAARIGRTRINYDLTRYLSENTMTRKSLEKMKEEFGSSEFLRLLAVGQNEESMAGILSSLKGMEEIRTVRYQPEEDRREEDGITCRLITLVLGRRR